MITGISTSVSQDRFTGVKIVSINLEWFIGSPIVVLLVPESPTMGQMLSSTKKRPPDAQVADELSRNVESLSEVESSASEAHEADAKGN